MKNKNKINIMDQIKKKAEEVKIVEEKIPEKEIFYINYRSIIDFEELEIREEKIKKELINYEKIAIFNAREINKNTIELSKVFYKAQKLLAENKNGTFTKWYENLGFKKNFVYMLLKRNDLFLEFEETKVFEIPEKAIKSLSRMKDKINIKEVTEILNSKQPVEIAKQKENILLGDQTIKKEKTELIEYEEEILELSEKLFKEELLRKIKNIDEKQKKILKQYLKKIEKMLYE